MVQSKSKNRVLSIHQSEIFWKQGSGIPITENEMKACHGNITLIATLLLWMTASDLFRKNRLFYQDRSGESSLMSSS